MKQVKQETGMLVATEVATPAHVFEALKAGIDILWVGARTVTNPFAMQELADALKGVDIPILVKNPVNPDLELWVGAIEQRRTPTAGRHPSGIQLLREKNLPQRSALAYSDRTSPQIPQPHHLL